MFCNNVFSIQCNVLMNSHLFCQHLPLPPGNLIACRVFFWDLERFKLDLFNHSLPSLFPHFSLSLLQEILSGNPMDCESGYISKKRPHTIITFSVTFYVIILISHNLFCDYFYSISSFFTFFKKFSAVNLARNLRYCSFSSSS